MKKLLVVLFLLYSIMPVKAEYWANINDFYSVDLDSIYCSNDGFCAIWSRVNVARDNMKTINGERVVWIEYIDGFRKGYPYHQTLLEIMYDSNFRKLDGVLYPYGETPVEIPKSTIMELMYKIVFLDAKEIEKQKKFLQLGILKYLSLSGLNLEVQTYAPNGKKMELENFMKNMQSN